MRDNSFEGYWCAPKGSGSEYLSEHAIHFWQGSRDTWVERNRIMNVARGIGLGFERPGRTYTDNPCPGVSTAGHFGGIVRNNFISVTDTAVFASGSGFDTGIALWSACGATVVHNTVASSQAPRSSSIEWRFAETTVVLGNNLTTGPQKDRGGKLTQNAGNLQGIPMGLFSDPPSGDLHLLPTASVAIDKGATRFFRGEW